MCRDNEYFSSILKGVRMTLLVEFVANSSEVFFCAQLSFFPKFPTVTTTTGRLLGRLIFNTIFNTIN